MTDVFISYSRKDREFMRTLYERLQQSQRDVWVDWEDIPPSAEWLREIEQAIEAADAFIFVLSANSLASRVCVHEVEHAVRYNKRIIPVVFEDVDARLAPAPLDRLNWLFFRPSDDFTASFEALVKAVDTDLPWVRAHTRLLVRAREWETHGRDKSYVLMGSDLDEAERLLGDDRLRDPPVAPLQMAYVMASRHRDTELQKKQLRGFYVVSIIYSLLQAVVLYLLLFDEISEAMLIMVSPIWVLGLVFGTYGLVFGSTSMKRSLIATGVAAVSLLAFFVFVWEFL